MLATSCCRCDLMLQPLVVQTPGDDDIEPHYRRLLSELTEKEEYALNIDCKALYEHSSECSRLYDQLVKYPPEVCACPLAGRMCAFLMFDRGHADYFHHGLGCEPRVSANVEGEGFAAGH
jgi:hypothetical protein